MSNNLILCNIPWYSGLSYYAATVTRFLIKKNERVFWALERETVLWNELTKIKGLELLPVRSRKPYDFFSNLKRINKIPQINPQRILVFTGPDFLTSFFIKKAPDCKIIRFRTESYGLKKNFLNKFLYSKCDMIIAGNNKIKSEILALGIDGKKIQTIYPCVDTEKFRVSPLPENVRIGFLGRLDNIKGIDILRDAMNIVWKRYPKVELYLAGEEVNYKWDDIKSDFKGPVKYVGRIGYEKVPAFLRDCLFGVIPSTGSEATSRALIEWWSSGRPVVASSVGMLEEAVSDGQNGMLVRPSDSRALADAICSLLGNRKLIESMSFAAAKTAQSDFSIESFEKNLIYVLITSYE